jgi:hypothetical protein
MNPALRFALEVYGVPGPALDALDKAIPAGERLLAKKKQLDALWKEMEPDLVLVAAAAEDLAAYAAEKPQSA